MTKTTIFLKDMMIEYENLAKVNKPYFEEYKKAFSNVLDSGWFVLGENVKQFENKFADYIGVNHCIGVASGLDALILAIRALDLEKGSEIIVPSNTYIATILAIIHCGYTPVLVEPDINTYNIDPARLEESINDKTRVIMVVHLYGKACNMDLILEVCAKHKLYLIEDCAQAHGAEYKGKKVGSFGEMAAFSFYPTKNLGCLGDGGAITTNSPIYEEKILMLRNYGSKVKYYNQIIGYNSRLDEVQAAFLNIKLKYLDEINKHKRLLALIYSNNLKKDFILPVQEEGYFDVFHIYNIRHEKRDSLKEYLLKNNIKTDIHYPVAPHKQKALEFLSHQNYPLSEDIHRTTLSLPISVFHTENDVYRVIEVLNKF